MAKLSASIGARSGLTITVALVTLLSACGGGGGDSPATTGPKAEGVYGGAFGTRGAGVD